MCFGKATPLQIPSCLLSGSGQIVSSSLKCSNKLAILEYFHTETFEVALISETSQAFPNGRQASHSNLSP